MMVHAARGLEFPAVVVPTADLLPTSIQPDEIHDTDLLYVALTRATDNSAVTWVGRSAFTDRVLRSNKAVALP
jgi:superfamily I DNA/RNA helicase